MNILRKSGQGAGAVFGHYQRVLYTDATVPGNVDTGLDGHDEAGGQDSSAQLTDRRGLVDIEADPVPGAVLEALRPTGIGDDPPADVVDLFRRDPGPHGGGTGGLGGLDDVEDAGQLPFRLGVDAEGTG